MREWHTHVTTPRDPLPSLTVYRWSLHQHQQDQPVGICAAAIKQGIYNYYHEGGSSRIYSRDNNAAGVQGEANCFLAAL